MKVLCCFLKIHSGYQYVGDELINFFGSFWCFFSSGSLVDLEDDWIGMWMGCIFVLQIPVFFLLDFLQEDEAFLLMNRFRFPFFNFLRHTHTQSHTWQISSEILRLPIQSSLWKVEKPTIFFGLELWLTR